MSMNPTASRHDFHQLSDEQQDRYASLLTTLNAQSLSCRCEMAGKDFVVVVAPGLSSPNYWLKRFDLTQ